MPVQLSKYVHVLLFSTALAVTSAVASASAAPQGFLCFGGQALTPSLYVFHHALTSDFGSATVVLSGKTGFETGFAPYSIEILGNNDEAYSYKLAPGVAATLEQLSIQVPAPKPCGRGGCDLANFPSPAQATLIKEGIAATLGCNVL
jgi:hypothetical protein